MNTAYILFCELIHRVLIYNNNINFNAVTVIKLSCSLTLNWVAILTIFSMTHASKVNMWTKNNLKPQCCYPA